ncbi:MAG: L,D-transpeptidase [Mogibacterium sp.]|nr:L,D-transpeptidase [Mogibacterium sp.]
MNRKARIISMLLAIQMIFMTAATGVLALDDTTSVSQDPASTVTESIEETAVPESEEQSEASGSDGAQTEGQISTEQSDGLTNDQQTGENVEDQSEDVLGSAGIEEADDVKVKVSVNGPAATITLSGDEADLKKVEKIIVVRNGETEKTVAADEDGKTKITGLSVGSKYVFKAATEKDKVLGKSDEVEIKYAIAHPTGVVAAPGHKSVTVYWKAVEGATGYEIYRSNEKGKNYKLLKKVGAGKTSYRDKTVVEGPSGNTGKVYEYKYYVVTVSGDQKSDKSEIEKAGKVRSALYEITFKSSAKLTSHDKYKKSITFKAGQTVYADGFAQGKYQFSYKKGSKTYRFYSMWMRIKNPKGHIKKNAYQNGHTATDYVNQGGYNSKTKWLIWVNIYSQRVYVFKGKKGNWKLVKDWQCGSGTPKTPTSSGMNKKLHRKAKHYSKHKWWNMFSGTMAIHGSNGAKEEAKLGKLISNGCVRVTNDQAQWVFNNVSIGTRVLIY